MAVVVVVVAVAVAVAVAVVVVAVVVVVVVVPFFFGIKHSYNIITNPIQVKIINPSLTPITI